MIKKIDLISPNLMDEIPKEMLNSSIKKKKRTTIKKEDKERILKNQSNRCKFCKKKLNKNLKNYDLDHIVPHSIGGKNIKENIQALCLECHRIKTMNDNKIIKHIKNEKKKNNISNWPLDLLRI